MEVTTAETAGIDTGGERVANAERAGDDVRRERTRT